MDRKFFRLRYYLQKRRYNVKRIHKAWVDVGTGCRAVFTVLLTVAQGCLLILAYAFLATHFKIFFWASVGLTAFTDICVLVCEPDIQSKISWTLLFLASFGMGYIIYILSRKPVTYGISRIRYKKLAKKYGGFFPPFNPEKQEEPVRSDCAYMYDGGGYAPYDGTSAKYYPYARDIMLNIVNRIESAEKFVFMEFFIVADGVFLDRLISIFKRKCAEGVEIRLLYDDVGSAGVLSAYTKSRIKATGVKIKPFKRLLSPFYFGLNYRDHRKIVVVDGETGYIGGFNMIDDCANQRKMEGVWKDSGLRLDGAAVDGLSLTFMRQWELATREKLDCARYLNLYERQENTSVFVPYAGGPEITEPLCRGVYHRIIDGAKQKLYIMTPYLVPDSDTLKALVRKAKEGVDVRLILPGVPDYRYIYRVTQSNARKLMRRGVKVCYASGEFVHSKVVLSENCVAVGSVNMDMRAFYQEFDNGVYTDDKTVMAEVAADFDEVLSRNSFEERSKTHPVSAFIAGILRIVSPLM